MESRENQVNIFPWNKVGLNQENRKIKIHNILTIMFISFISWCCGPRNKDSESFGTISILITSLNSTKILWEHGLRNLKKFYNFNRTCNWLFKKTYQYLWLVPGRRWKRKSLASPIAMGNSCRQTLLAEDQNFKADTRYQRFVGGGAGPCHDFE